LDRICQDYRVFTGGANAVSGNFLLENCLYFPSPIHGYLYPLSPFDAYYILLMDIFNIWWAKICYQAYVAYNFLSENIIGEEIHFIDKFFGFRLTSGEKWGILRS
jgi:hypothetical protein